MRTIKSLLFEKLVGTYKGKYSIRFNKAWIIIFRIGKDGDIVQKLGILPTNLSEILNGKRNISPKLAVKLEKALNISAEYWLNLQMAWDLQNAREEELV